MGDYLEKFYKRNMTIEELVRRASSTTSLEQMGYAQSPNDASVKYETVIYNYLDRGQVLFLYLYFLGVIYFLADYLSLLT